LVKGNGKAKWVKCKEIKALDLNVRLSRS